MSDVVITEFMDEAGVRILTAAFDTLYEPQLVDRPDELIAALAGARALVVRNRTRVTPAMVAAAPGLSVVGRLGVGLDNIDLPACAARGVTVLPATGTNDETVAEFVIGAIVTLLRGGAFQVTEEVLAGRWPRTRLAGRDAKGLRLGLVGFGAIARHVAARARAFGMTIMAADPFVVADDPAWRELGVERRTLDAMLPEADILSIHVPLGPKTRNLVDAAALAALPQGAVLINTARGGIVSEGALVAALRSGRLAGAVLDVMEEEPLKAGSILTDAPNLILSPHVAGVTADANLRASVLTAENVVRVLRSEAPTVADAARSA